MSTSDQPILYKYVGDGSTTVFPYHCHVLETGHMKVFLGTTYQSTGYTVDGIGDAEGGNVTFTTAPTRGVIVMLLRWVDYSRPTDYQPSGPFLEEVMDADQDRQTMQIQQLVEDLNRTFKMPVGTDLGFCSDTAYTDQDSCTLNGGTWSTGSGLYGSCSDTQYKTQYTCVNASETWTWGRCSDTDYTTEATCTLNGGTWTTYYGYCSNSQYDDDPQACQLNGGTYYYGTCSDSQYTDEATCTINGGTWTTESNATNGVNTVVPDPVPNGIWMWDATGTNVTFLTIDELVDLLTTDFPAPTPQDVLYYGWSLADERFADGENYFDLTGSALSGDDYGLIDSSMTKLEITLANIRLKDQGSAGIALIPIISGNIDDANVVTLDDAVYAGNTTTVANDGTITQKEWDQSGGIPSQFPLTGGHYIPLVYDLNSNGEGYLNGTVTITKAGAGEIGTNWIVEINTVKASIQDNTKAELNYGVGRFQTVGTTITGVRMQTGDSQQFNWSNVAGEEPTVRVKQYANLLTFPIDTITIDSGRANEQLIAEYGNMGATFINIGDGNDLVFQYNGNRIEYPPVLEGQSIWFLATANNTGNVTAQLSDQTALSVLDEAGAELPASTFTADKMYRIYKRGATFRYAVPEQATVADGSITLVKHATGTPETYLHFDVNGDPEYLAQAPGSGPFTASYEDGTGVTYSAANQAVSWTHGLGAIPFGYLIEAECITADGGYSTGRRLLLVNAISGTTAALGASISSDNTKIYLKVGGSGLMHIQASAFNYFFLTPGKWKFFAKAWV